MNKTEMKKEEEEKDELKEELNKINDYTISYVLTHRN